MRENPAEETGEHADALVGPLRTGCGFDGEGARVAYGFLGEIFVVEGVSRRLSGGLPGGGTVFVLDYDHRVGVCGYVAAAGAVEAVVSQVPQGNVLALLELADRVVCWDVVRLQGNAPV